MKKGILTAGIVVTTIIMLLGILYFFNGSLEMYPTEEKMESVRISASVIVIISLIVDVVLVRMIKKY